MRYMPKVTFALTLHQYNQIRLLVRVLWPNQILDRNELCRRLVLDGADVMLAQLSADKVHENLLEPGCEPTARERSIA